jgi:formate/nitrite transporter FocA (FNT family)
VTFDTSPDSKDPKPTTPEEQAKPEDSPKTPSRTMLERGISSGREELERNSGGLFLSSISAGLDVGFGPFLMVALLSFVTDQVSPLNLRVLLAAAYGIGFILVVLGRSELFTEHTAMAALPLLAGRARISAVSRLWGIVLVGNLIGAIAFSLLAVPIAVSLGIATEGALAEVAHTLTGHPGWVILGSAVLAGWLMGLLSWLVLATNDTLAQIVIVWLITGAIGIAGLHHSIAGTVEVAFGVLGADVTLAEATRVIGITIIGNAIGGTVFVALLKYQHAIRSAPVQNETNQEA